MRTLLIFFCLAYAITWTLFITVAVAVPAGTSAGYALVLIGTYSPAIAALSLTAWKNGLTGVRSLLRRILHVNVPARYYLFAVSYMAAIKIAAAVLHRVLLGVWPQFGTEDLLLIPFAIVLSTPFQAGEEIGWRGYALPQLAARFGLPRASLLLGAIWAVWHLPQFYIAGADTYQQSFPVWAMQAIALSVAFAWLYARSAGSLLLVMLLHAAINNSKDIVPSGVRDAPGVFSLHASPVAWLATGLLWICAAILLQRMRRLAVPTSVCGPSARSEPASSATSPVRCGFAAGSEAPGRRFRLEWPSARRSSAAAPAPAGLRQAPP
jgi:membrane protease YdiL (CAAX protease family)